MVSHISLKPYCFTTAVSLEKNIYLNGLLICLKWLSDLVGGGRTEWPTENSDFKILLYNGFLLLKKGYTVLNS